MDAVIFQEQTPSIIFCVSQTSNVKGGYTMEAVFSRRDIGYTIISRFEESFRAFLSNKIPISFGNNFDSVPQGVIEKAKVHNSSTDWESIEDLLDDTDFPDLKEIVCFKNNYSFYFPSSGVSKEDFIIMMDELYKLRCKIAHIRRYFSILDLTNLLDNTKNLAKDLDDSGKEFINLMMVLENNPEKVVIPMPKDFVCDGIDLLTIPNNLPTPDYDYEGGFVGREDDIRKLLSLLEGHHQVITITGAGGVGKTALALQVIKDFIRASKIQYDGVVWLSAKEEKLSCFGIEPVEPTFKTYEQLLDSILEVMGFGIAYQTPVLEQKEKDVQTIFELFAHILIVIDNLETITDERIINFVLDINPKVKMLITSRTGLGQVERRYELKQLKEKEAMYLFRQIAREKHVEMLAALDDTTVKNYVKKVSCYPLAIKWVIGHVALGKDIHLIIDSINETTSDISLFCFDQIYKNLSHKAKKIIAVLSCFEEPPVAGILKYVTDLTQIEFDDGIRELILVSLVVTEQFKNEQNEISTRYSLLSLTRGFVRRQLDDEPVLKRNIEERLQSVHNITEEAERAKKLYRFSLSYLGANTDEEKVASVLAQTAYQKYSTGRYLDAVEDYKRAVNIAPRFASLYRNWAVMESQEGHFVDADKLMNKASKLSPNDVQIWLTWGNLKRKIDKIKEALDLYEKAYKLSPDDNVVLNALGQAKARLGENEEADKLFRSALSKDPAGTSIKHNIINFSSLADNLRRWSESLKKDRNIKEAENKLKEAMQYCYKALELDKNDVRSQDLKREILIDLGLLYRESQPNLAVEYFSKAVVENPRRYREAKDTIFASLYAAKILYRNGQIEEAKKIFTPKLRKVKEPLKRDQSLHDDFSDLWDALYEDRNTLQGKIIQIDDQRNFTIIESSISPGITYLGHINDFKPKIFNISKNLAGKVVSFSIDGTMTNKERRPKAKCIRILSSECVPKRDALK